MRTSKLFTLSITLLTFILPLFFLPLTTEFYVFNKITLFYYFIALLLILWGVRIFKEQKLILQKGFLNWPILGLTITFLLSTLIQAPNRLMSLANPAGIILGLSLLYFIITNNISGKKAADWIITSLIISSIILAWLTIFAYLGLNENFGPQWLKNKAWTPTGSPLNTLSLMLVLLPPTLFWAFKTKAGAEKILLFLASSLQILASILIIYLFINKTIQFIYLPPQYGWQICVEGFKTLRTALLGVGPGNFLSAFSRFRPVGLNNTDVWTAKFRANSNEYFNLLSTVGLLGLGAYILLIWQSLKKENWRGLLIKKVLFIILATSFIIQLLIPANVLIWFIIFLAIGLLQVLKRPAQAEIAEVHQIKAKPAVWGTCGVFSVLALAVFYLQGRAWAADYYFRKSLLAAQENRGIDTYNLQIKAIKLNPFVEGYRITYSNTNFALANSLATKADLSDQDRANISQLISQSIREAKATINLNPQISSYWVNLASIYRNIINVAQGADQWAIAAYREAVRTDPTNPLLRVDFGGLFYALEDYDQALEQFKIAVNLKPDYANGYYNLAAAYRKKEEWQKAFQNMQLAVNLVPVDSPDRSRVMEELEELKAKLPTPPQEATRAGALKEEERLKPPQALPSPKPGFKEITLPEEVEPEVPGMPEASPETSPEASPSPTSNPSSEL